MTNQNNKQKLAKAAPDLLNALRLMKKHHDDILKSNTFGNMCLQDYGLMNEALIATNEVLSNFEESE